MTYLELYRSLASVDEIKKKAFDDTKVALFLGGNPDRIRAIEDAMNEAIREMEVNRMDDLISRQAAIDIERNATVDTNPSHFEAHQKFTQFMDDAEISSFGRWQWANGFNTALTAVGIDLKKLPSAQPEIIRCRNCKFASGDSRICMKFGHSPIGELDFCAWAERKSDEQ